ncbi:MAG: hypothetical protein WBH51_20935 [Mycolicibacter algericus]|uniref:hypothetical protein n=1 Tax=Mycolicibacter algericus TaxID=1288388 RepID=UPI003C751503
MKTQRFGGRVVTGVVALAVGTIGAGLAAADPGEGVTAGNGGGAETNSGPFGGDLNDGSFKLWPSDHAADNVNLGPFSGGFDAGTAGEFDQGAAGGDGPAGDGRSGDNAGGMPFLW